jgi:hypothetical protein
LILEEHNSEKVNKDIFWPIQLKGIWRDRPLLNPVYDIEDHGVSCKCCTRIAKEPITCPTKEERIQRWLKPQRGRPRLKERRGSEK